MSLQNEVSDIEGDFCSVCEKFHDDEEELMDCEFCGERHCWRICEEEENDPNNEEESEQSGDEEEPQD